MAMSLPYIGCRITNSHGRQVPSWPATVT